MMFSLLQPPAVRAEIIDDQGACPHCGRTFRDGAFDALRRIAVTVPYSQREENTVTQPTNHRKE